MVLRARHGPRNKMNEYVILADAAHSLGRYSAVHCGTCAHWPTRVRLTSHAPHPQKYGERTGRCRWRGEARSVIVHSWPARGGGEKKRGKKNPSPFNILSSVHIGHRFAAGQEGMRRSSGAPRAGPSGAQGRMGSGCFAG